MFLVFFGIQGAGKGTQADLVSKKLGIPHISTGEILRSISSENTPLGHELSEMLARGQYLDDKRMTEILKERLPQSCILDGYPRTLRQAELLDTIENVDAVVHIDLHDEEATRRMLLRGRADDHPEAIHKRFQQYHAAADSILNRYKAQGKLVTINGDQNIDAVYKELCAALKI